MTSLQKSKQAALNNALWCDAVCCSHGCPGEFRDAAWVNRKQTPPFYPNAVTLGGASQASLHRHQIHEVIQTEIATGWAIKDSFQTLNLNPIGFRVLFEAQWIYKSALVPARSICVPVVHWEIITTAPLLEEWEKAWGGKSDIAGIFLPELLNNKEVTIMAARREGQIVAGFVANRASDCVGISNIFVPVEDAQQFRNHCIINAQSIFPNLPLVGYESGSDLTDMQSCGFEVVGDLTVWIL